VGSALLRKFRRGHHAVEHADPVLVLGIRHPGPYPYAANDGPDQVNPLFARGRHAGQYAGQAPFGQYGQYPDLSLSRVQGRLGCIARHHLHVVGVHGSEGFAASLEGDKTQHFWINTRLLCQARHLEPVLAADGA
jgi:hypothetical protein